MKLILTILLFFFLACQSSQKVAKQGMDQQVDFVDINEARSFDVPESGTSVIKSETELTEWWQKYWNQFSGSGEKTSPPEVDFNKEMIIVIHWGRGYSGCSNKVNVIREINKSKDSLNVIVDNLPDLGPCDMEVSPIQMVKIPLMDLPVKFTGSIPKDK